MDDIVAAAVFAKEDEVKKIGSTVSACPSGMILVGDEAIVRWAEEERIFSSLSSSMVAVSEIKSNWIPRNYEKNAIRYNLFASSDN